SLDHIADSAERATHLINQLLLLARAEAGSERVYTMETVDLDAVVRDVAGELFPRAQAKHIDFGVEGEAGASMVEGNPVLLREMFKNLIDNAIKYTPRGGSVTARSFSEGAVPVVEVEDSGI